nr:PREDICTED: uncharacterized protein LOC109032326 [Bemisia tabaci]
MKCVDNLCRVKLFCFLNSLTMRSRGFAGTRVRKFGTASRDSPSVSSCFHFDRIVLYFVVQLNRAEIRLVVVLFRLRCFVSRRAIKSCGNSVCRGVISFGDVDISRRFLRSKRSFSTSRRTESCDGLSRWEILATTASVYHGLFRFSDSVMSAFSVASGNWITLSWSACRQLLIGVHVASCLSVSLRFV